MINASIGSLPDGSVGCDSASPLNPASARQHYNNKYRFIIRYVGRGDGSKTYADLTPGEGQAIIDAGLALGVVQHPLREGWTPSADLGTSFGAAAASLAGEAGLPFGVTVWLDLEGVAAGTPARNVIDYCNNWYAQVAALGYVPGLYVGANPGLTSDQLYWDLHTASYWRGGSSEAAGVPADIPHRGYQMVQRITGAGTTEFDSNTIKADNFGGAVQWCLGQPAREGGTV